MAMVINESPRKRLERQKLEQLESQAAKPVPG